MLFSEFYEIMVNKVTFVGFKGDDRTISPVDPPLDLRKWTASTVEVFLASELFMS